ncbi:MAG: flagellin N-terminal helical domain-containing protein [Syntrophales bacterium]
MGFVIQSNIAALNAQRTLNISSDAMNKSLQRLSSGYRINSAADDAAGLAISQMFSADIASYKVGSQNVSQANALLQVAGGALDQIDNMLTRLKELATQAASANAGSNLNKINNEGNSLIDEIDRIANSTKYAGTALINGSFSAGNTSVTWNAISNIYDLNVGNAAAGAYTAAYSATSNGLTITRTSDSVAQTVTLADGAHSANFSVLGISFSTTAAFVADTAGAAIAGAGMTVVAGGAANFQVGTSSDSNDRIGITLADVRSATLGVSKNQMDTAAHAQAFLDSINTAISNLSNAQGTIGAAQNRLGYASANLATTIQNYTAAQSTIRDVDMASEMTNFTKNQILVQAGTAMLAQANMAPQQVLSLFK